MEKKYEFTGETKVFKGVTVNRIIATKDFGFVKKGDKGGWIQKEENLSQFDRCWVGKEAVVFGEALIKDNAIITHKSNICDCAVVKDNAIVRGNVVIFGSVMVKDDARVSGHVVLQGNVTLMGEATVKDNSRLNDDVLVTDYASIIESAVICGKAVIGGKATIGGKAVIEGEYVYYGHEGKLFKPSVYIVDEVYITQGHIQSQVRLKPIVLLGLDYLITITDNNICVGWLHFPINYWFETSKKNMLLSLKKDIFDKNGLSNKMKDFLFEAESCNTVIDFWFKYKNSVQKICEMKRGYKSNKLIDWLSK